MKKLLATVVIGAGLAAGAVAFSAPSWAATCSLGANVPTTGNASWGGRYNCSGTVRLEERFAKDVSFASDPYLYYAVQNFGNGDLGVQGDCRNGAGSYYTWTVSSSGNSLESGRVGRC